MPKDTLKAPKPTTESNGEQLVNGATDGIDFLEIFGAREHNLKNIDLRFKRNQLVVITGISGSGKSSLAFDTIYAEGQRRYMESFSAYARSFIGELERPDVDKINGLSPVISIEQKTTSKNPRSTVGTVTEIYDFLRLLYARAGDAYSYLTGKKMTKQSEDQIIRQILKQYDGQKLAILAPVVKGRKGHYRELFQQIRKLGFSRARIDGALEEITPKMQLDRYKTHDIEIVIDRVVVSEKDANRITQSTKTAMTQGKGVMMILLEDGNVAHFSKTLMDPETGLAYDDPAPNTFSFNSPYGACPDCNGLGVIQEISRESVMPDPNISISRGGIAPLGEYRDIWIFKKLEVILKRHRLSLATPIKNIPEEALKIILFGDDEPVAVASVKYPGTEWNTKFEGIINFLEKQKDGGSDKMQQWVDEFTVSTICPSCHGARLKKEALHYKIDKKNISELSFMNITQLSEWFEGLETRLDERQNIIAAEVLKEIRKRIGFLLDVGLDYLNLDRPLRTLSGGEAQRIRLATQIGTQLVGVLYILDEPSIGLHQRDNVKLIKALKDLRDLGNTVIVVEHDRDMMMESDFLIDIGPGAGRHGGQVVAAGTPQEVLESNSLTAGYLNGINKIAVPKERRKGKGESIVLKGATGHNLKNVTLTLPIGKMLCITGVSGSGKSSLIHETLFPILRKHFYGSRSEPLPYTEIKGVEHIDKVIEVDQAPIGRTPRSNPATYTGAFSDIRLLFSNLPEAKIRGYKPGRFSFNVKGGRCETCEGAGMKVIEMDFLPDVHVPCETCKGKRYNRETLEVRFKGKSISDVLDMTVEQAVEFFEFQPKILRRIQTLHEVGLDYITLGQHATTLSGGEAQRVKLATELSKKDTGKTLYILDEPTTGLHFKDIQHLIDVLNKLVNKGNTVLIIEHNLDVIKVADHVIDLGLEGGDKGGQILAEGTPEEVARKQVGYTSKFLKEELERA
ncbi:MULTISPECIES: excinuclease ABC subunit UvrA [unclassified Imperialibacter]|uniref:excinuclease ABC subunit UvrA n=1 Tax=unclassified Imperialibacter TaxID=2629706 RepID=UPI001252B244|nr:MULTISPECIES: excinuclease ABC subunit UvrA [unclassified Imperialibacter]CAD5271030.1 ATPase and DNA damage recognition protein of nucleotide excision repair excinuclease UvrABC [Imperialibacter sp. 89]CAD5298579.1 ATPase and DNA damage recognition protein of nucleotide excision repair excinuclease UvrABC [Imperialibacter sp. 75]VVT34969.1 ATPase and DNA damage recognition protein of nucleotide excision repair excinuclease UvrABC [Imperialibacter sp. EC-SDR9]